MLSSCRLSSLLVLLSLHVTSCFLLSCVTLLLLLFLFFCIFVVIVVCLGGVYVVLFFCWVIVMVVMAVCVCVRARVVCVYMCVCVFVYCCCCWCFDYVVDVAVVVLFFIMVNRGVQSINSFFKLHTFVPLSHDNGPFCHCRNSSTQSLPPRLVLNDSVGWAHGLCDGKRQGAKDVDIDFPFLFYFSSLGFTSALPCGGLVGWTGRSKPRTY